MKLPIRYISAIVLSCLCSAVYAQFGFGGGLGYGFPSLINRQGFNNNNGVLGGLQVFYRLPHSRLYPSLNFHAGLIQLPVKADGYNDLNVTATNRNLSLHLNYRFGNGNQYLIAYAGAGFATIIPDGTSVQENGMAVSLQLNNPGTGSYAVMNAGGLCTIRLSADLPLYLGIEAYLQYLQLNNNDKQYYLDFNGSSIKASISGNYLYPVLLANIIYIFEKAKTESPVN